MQKTKEVTTNTGLVPGHNIRVRELAPIMGMSKNTIWRLAREGKFPKPLKISEKITVWETNAVIKWLASKAVV